MKILAKMFLPSFTALVAQRIEPLTPNEQIEVQFPSRAPGARSIEVTRDYGIVESGVQFPAGPHENYSFRARSLGECFGDYFK